MRRAKSRLHVASGRQVKRPASRKHRRSPVRPCRPSKVRSGDSCATATTIDFQAEPAPRRPSFRQSFQGLRQFLDDSHALKASRPSRGPASRDDLDKVPDCTKPRYMLCSLCSLCEERVKGGGSLRRAVRWRLSRSAGDLTIALPLRSRLFNRQRQTTEDMGSEDQASLAVLKRAEAGMRKRRARLSTALRPLLTFHAPD
jgi:hypothetical protein